MYNYKELKIWQKSMDLAEKDYAITNLLRKEEKHELTSQIQRSATSIPSNITEVSGRNSNKKFKHFLSISDGLANELNTQLLLSLRIGHLEELQLKDIFNLLTVIQKMNFVLINKFSKI